MQRATRSFVKTAASWRSLGAVTMCCVSLILVACSKKSTKFDFLDEGSNAQEEKAIVISSFTPTASPVVMVGSNSTTFAVAVNSDAGIVTYSYILNGSTLGTGTDPFYNLSGAVLSSGSNSFEIKATNSVSVASKVFTIRKNTAPVVVTSNPGATGNVILCGSGALAFSVTASDADVDNLIFTWKLNGSVGSAALTATDSAGSSTAGFTPACSLTGSHTLSVEVSDGHEITIQSWAVNVTNPAVATINSYNPTDATVIIPSTTAKTFTVGATGSGTLGYSWKLSGTTIPGANSSLYTLNASTILPLGYSPQTLEATVEDETSSDSHTFNVVLNAPPVLSNQSPAASVIKNHSTPDITFSVTGADANGDSIIYTWTYDGSTSLPAAMSTSSTASGSQAIFNPDSSHVGTHTITVTARENRASDYENSNTITWNVTFNYFSDKCNSLEAGEICTLVGRPGLMNDSDLDGMYAATTEPIKIRPQYLANDGSGNLFISDSDSHVVWFLNRSGAAVTRLGRTIEAGKMKILVGNGGAGKTTDDSATYAYERYKLNGPQMMYYDSVNDYLYIADFFNHRVVRVNGSGQGRRVFGTEAYTPNDITTNAKDIAAKSHICGFPIGLVVNAAKDRMWVSCTGNGNNNLSAVKEINMTNVNSNSWTAKTIVGMAANGSADGERSDSLNYHWGITGVAATDIFTHTAHPFADNQAVHLISKTNGAGVTAGDGTYFYIKNATADTYQLSTAPGGAAVNFTNNISAGVIAEPLATGLTANNSNERFTLNGHPFVEGDPILFTGRSAGAGFSLNTTYFVKYIDANNFQIATTVGGAAVDVSSNPAGVGVMRGPASANYPWALALDSNENLYWTENNSQGHLRFLRRNASPASFFNGSVSASVLDRAYTLAGGNNDAPNNATNVALTAARWRDARGLAIYESGGNIETFFLTMGLRTFVLGLNNSTATQSYGGRSLTTALPAGIVWGVYADPDVDTIVGPAITNRVFNPTGVLVIGSKLMLADTHNFVVRSLDLSTGDLAKEAGGVTSKYRARWDSTGSEAAPTTELFKVSQILYDSIFAQPRLLIGDNSNIGVGWAENETVATQNSTGFNPNYRMRSLDLTTGLVTTLFGGGLGNSDSGTHTRTSATIQGLRGMTLKSDGSVIFVDRGQYSTGTNRNCQIRAVNLTASDQTYYGVLSPANFITTLFGNYANGCANATETTGTATGLNYPEGVVQSGTDLYVSEYNRHCIWKLDASNNATAAIGLCGTQGDVASDFSTTRLRYPKQLMQDPRFPTNFFIMDQTNQTTSSIKYVNLSGQDCDVGAGHACEVAGAAALDQRVVSALLVNGGFGNAMAYYADPSGIASDVICYASSESHNNTILQIGETQYGSNNVKCVNRVTGALNLRIGQNDNSILNSGMQIDSEDERKLQVGGVLNVTLNGPSGLTFDVNGNLYISEKNAHVVRKVKKWW